MKKVIGLLLFLTGSAWAAGTVNTLPKYTTTSQLGNSNVTDNGSTVTISVPLVVSTPTVTQLKFADGTSQTTAASVPTPLLLGNGSVGAPAFSFTAHTGDGMWDNGSLKFSVGSAQVLSISGSFADFNPTVRSQAGFVDAGGGGVSTTGNYTTSANGTAGGDTYAGPQGNQGMFFTAGNTFLSALGATIFSGTSTGAQVLGTTLANNATTGNYGEFSATTTIVFANIASTGQFGNVVSFSLTAGDWDLSANVTLKLNGAVITDYEVAVSSFSANTTTDHVEGYNWTESAGFPIATANSTLSVPQYRVTLAGTTTMFLKCKGAFSVATPQALGTLIARRAR